MVLMLVAALAVLFAAGFLLMQPVEIVVDGRDVSVPTGTTLGDLPELGVVQAPPGDLIAIDGSIEATRQGAAPSLELNGRRAASEVRLFAGDRVVSARGSDIREALATTETAIPFKTVYRGRGPWLEIATLGVPGVRRLTVGERSGIVARVETITPVTDEVVVRTRPRPGAKLVALTFDDGPTPGQTDRVLDILKKEQVHATFFMLGRRIKEDPQIARRAVAEGHLIGNHSYNHPDLRKLDDGAIAKQVTATRDKIRGVAGSGSAWFRPPYGAVDPHVLKTLRKMDQKVVMWDVDPQDWRKPGVKSLVTRVVSQTEPGSVILLHDGGGDRRRTISALPYIIRELKKRGYVFVTVAELATYPREGAASGTQTSTPPDGYGQ